MNTRTQNIINLLFNSSVIVGGVISSSYAYSLAPQLKGLTPVASLTVAMAMGVAIKICRAYPYYLSTLTTPAPGAWRWLILGTALEGFDLAVLGHLFKLNMSIDSILPASAALWGYAGSWGMVAMMHDLGLRPVKRKSIYTQWFGKQSKPKVSIDSPSPSPSTATDIINPIDYSDYQEIELGGDTRAAVDPDIIRNLLGDSMKSTFFCGIQGSGKGFLVSLMAAEARRQGNKVFLLDPKGDEDEKSLWTGAVNRVSRFVGRKEESPESYVEKIKGAIKAYIEYADENGKSKYTILVFDEFSSAAGKFATTKESKLWLTNEIEDLVKLGDAAGICLWLVAQTPHCKNGIDGSLLSSLRRIIIASEDNLAQLQNWTNTTFMNGISLDECAKMCQLSPVNRSVYNSVTREWYAMPRLRQGETYFDRDSRQMMGNSMN